MNKAAALQANPAAVRRNKVKTFFSKPHNVILLLMGIVLTITTVAPIVAIVQDTFKIHPGTIDAHLTGQVSGYTLVNYIDLFTSPLAKINLWTPCGIPSCFRSAPASWPSFSAAFLRSSSHAPIFPAANI